MAIHITSHEVKTLTSRYGIPADKMYRGITTNTDIVIQNALPNVTNVQLVGGRRGPGTYMRVYLVEDEMIKSKNMRIDVINEADKLFEYSIIEGSSDFDAWTTEKISYETRILEGDGGGSIAETSVIHHIWTRDGVDPPSLEETEVQGFDVMEYVENYLE